MGFLKGVQCGFAIHIHSEMTNTINLIKTSNKIKPNIYLFCGENT